MNAPCNFGDRRPAWREQARDLAEEVRTILASIILGLLLAVVGWGGTDAHAQGASAPTTVEVFANSAMRITPEDAGQRRDLPFKLDIYRVDAMQNAVQVLNQQLPQTEEAARAWMMANEARIRQQLGPAVQQSAHGITLAATYRLKKLPAIVINRSIVVYGETDIAHAIALARESGQ